MPFIFRKLYKLFTKVLIMLIQVTAVTFFFLPLRKGAASVGTFSASYCCGEHGFELHSDQTSFLI